MFIDFKKAYDSKYRDSLYKIMFEFGFPQKLMQLTKLCMEEMLYQVRLNNTMSSPFTVETGLKQEVTLSTILFIIALKKMVRKLQHNECVL